MFVVRKINYRPWPVKVVFQEADAAGVIQSLEQTFIGHFRPFSEAEFEAVSAQVRGDDKPGDLPLAELLRRNADLFGSLLSGWSGVADVNGVPLPYSTEALRELVTGPDGLVVSAAINVALGEIRFGAAAAKNSTTSGGDGRMPAPAEAAPSAL